MCTSTFLVEISVTLIEVWICNHWSEINGGWVVWGFLELGKLGGGRGGCAIREEGI